MVATIVTNATNNGKSRILRFFAKSKFSLNSSMNITLKVAEKAFHPVNGSFKFLPRVDEFNFSTWVSPSSSDQSLLVMVTGRIHSSSLEDSSLRRSASSIECPTNRMNTSSNVSFSDSFSPETVPAARTLPLLIIAILLHILSAISRT